MAGTLISEPAHAIPNGPVKPGHSVLHDPSGVLNRMLTSNAQWASDVARVEPRFFEQCSKGQAPKVSFLQLGGMQPNGRAGITVVPVGCLSSWPVHIV